MLEFARHLLEDDRYSKVPSLDVGVARSQGIKGSPVVLARDAIKISEEEVRNDFDHNWKHLKSPMKGVDAGTSTDRAHLLTNSESSISKPFVKSSNLKRRKFVDAGMLTKFPIEIKGHLSYPCK